jgi:carbon monoxide dehydrogenase subunit G
MKLHEEFEVAEPLAAVWRFFEQPEAVAQCVPGVEQLTVVTPDDIDVRLTQSVGPMTATFAASVKIVERVPEKLIGFTATGKSVRGAMGNVRQKVVAKQAGKVTGQFARNLEAALGGGTAVAATGADASAAAARPSALRSLPQVSDAPAAGGDLWSKVAAGLSALSVAVSVVALVRSRRQPQR